MVAQHNCSIGKFWWCWLPLIYIVVHVVMQFALPAPTMMSLMQENGPDEMGQFLILVGAFLIALSILIGFPVRGHGWLTAYLVLAAVCCFFVAGEEVSWGQWFFHWPTPQQWAAMNTQKETNIHNTYRWANQQPRAFLEAGVFVGGLLIPLLRKFKPSLLPARFAIIYPPAILAVTALALTFFKLTNVVLGHHILHTTIFTKVEEMEETCMYYFVLLYMIVMRQRLKPLKHEEQPVVAGQS